MLLVLQLENKQNILYTNLIYNNFPYNINNDFVKLKTSLKHYWKSYTYHSILFYQFVFLEVTNVF